MDFECIMLSEVRLRKNETTQFQLYVESKNQKQNRTKSRLIGTENRLWLPEERN